MDIDCFNVDLFHFFYSIVGARMLRHSTLVLLLTALTSVWAQDYSEDRRTSKRPRPKHLAANIHNGQGRTVVKTSFLISFNVI